MTLDLDFVRSQFPALAGEWTFLDNAGGSQVLTGVADRMRDYLLTTSVQLGASYAPSQQAGERVAESRRAYATFMNADAGEIIMGASTTELIRRLSEAMTGRLQPGDEIILTNTDHEANIGPWLRHAARGVEVKFWNCDPESFELRLEDLKGLMTDRTRLVCVTHASNILGTINPVREIADIAHAAGAEVCVDGVAYAPHREIDVQALGCDYYVFSTYKVFGPHHAVMYVKRDRLEALDNIYHYFFSKAYMPGKIEPGNVNYEAAYAAIGAVDYVQELGRQAGAAPGRAAVSAGFSAIAEQETALTRQLLDFLMSRNGVRIIGRATAAQDERVATISFTVRDENAASIVAGVDPHKIGIRHGDFYARRLVDETGLAPQGGVVRVSMVHYNTQDEIARLIRVLEPLV